MIVFSAFPRIRVLGRRRCAAVVIFALVLWRLVGIEQAFCQAPSGFSEVIPAAFTVEQTPPLNRPPIPGPVADGIQPAAQPLATPPPPVQPLPAIAPSTATPTIVAPDAVFAEPPAVPRFICPDAFHPMFRLHQTISDVVGDSGELTSLGGIFPHPSDYGLWFLDGQFDILEDAHNPGQQTLNFATSLGLGWRWLDAAGGQIYGVNGWYDADRSHPGFVHQASVGVELLGEAWEWRANGYFPCGATRQPVAFTSLGPVFPGAEALPGVDLECGRIMDGWLGDYGVAVYSGCYYYRDDRNFDIFGGSVRLESKISETLTLDVKMTHDSFFKTGCAFGITWILPTAGKCKTCRPQPPDYYRLVQPVVRNRTIVFGPPGIP